MSLERMLGLIERFRASFASPQDGSAAAWLFAPKLGIELLESMLLARHLDLQAHLLRAKGAGHYTICSSGHEANVVLGRLTCTTDPSLVHYRSAAFQVERARGIPGLEPVLDIALSLAASSEEPLCAGRHKAFGSRTLGIIPQTSTIASHLPRALGLALGLERMPRLGLCTTAPKDALVLASFGDASLNHSTALGTLNAVSWSLHQNLKMPLLLVCEDNALGVSVRTPPGWVETRLRALPHVAYFAADGWDLSATWSAASAAVSHCRIRRRAAVLHLRCERLLGHAGSDVDTTYRSGAELEQALACDPVLRMAQSLVVNGCVKRSEVLEMDRQAEQRVAKAAEIACQKPKLASRAQVLESLRPPHGSRPFYDRISPSRRARAAEPVQVGACTLAQGINLALSEALLTYPESLVFGEDVAKKGGVYGVTKGLHAQAGPARVFNTLLDEQGILGLALGLANLGMLPIPEIQYLAYLHNAEDQLRGEAATLSFFSGGAFTNGMVVRIAAFGYQKGFGGHFHNDNSLAVLRDIPGIVLCVPARGDDALELYRTSLELAHRQGQVVVMLEPIALYHHRDLLVAGDGGWLAAPSRRATEFAPRVYSPEADEVLLVSYGNGVRLSLRAAQRLREHHGLAARVMDLRWLSPLPIAELLQHAAEVGRVVVVDECRATGNLSETIATALLDNDIHLPWARVTSGDCFIPLGEAANLVLMSEAEIEAAALRVCRQTRSPKNPRL